MNVKSEPVSIATAVNMVVVAALGVATAFFGVDPTPEQITAVASLQAVIVLLIGMATRSLTVAFGPLKELETEAQRRERTGH